MFDYGGQQNYASFGDFSGAIVKASVFQFSDREFRGEATSERITIAREGS